MQLKHYVLFIRRLSAAAALCALAAAGCKAAADYGPLGKPDAPVPLLERIRTGKLDSGLTYFIMENAKPENRAYITIAVNAGSVLEEDDEQGLAHFVEHMAFNGTKNFPENELIEYLRSLGMRFGADINAYTSFDQTVYGIEVPVTKNDNGTKILPARALQIIDDWTHAVLFTGADVDDERPIIIEEYRAHLGADERSVQALLPLLFNGSQYGVREPIGKIDIIEHAPASRLAGFYQKWYRADNMAIIFVGDFDGAALEASLGGAFSIPAPETPLNKPVYTLPPPQKNTTRARIFTDPEITATDISLYYKLPWTPEGNTLKDFRAAVIDNLINKIVGERLSDAEYRVETPFFGAYSDKERFVNQSLHYITGAAAKDGNVKESLETLLRGNESIVRYGFLESEIERAKTSLLSDLEKLLAEDAKTDSQKYIYSLSAYYLTGEVFPGIRWEYDAVKTLLPGISGKEIHHAAKAYFDSRDLFVFIKANDGAAGEIPSEDEIVDLVSAVRKAVIEKPKETRLLEDLLDDVPSSGEISGESVDNDTGTVIWTLSNGAKVLLKPTANKNDEIVLDAMARGGWTSAPLSQLISAKLSAELVSASGLGRWKVPELTKKLTGKQVMLSFGTSAFTRTIEGRSTIADLPVFFQLLHLGFTAPRTDADTAEIIKTEYRTILARRDENPEQVFNNEITRIRYNNNPYFMPLEIADLDKFDIDTAHDWALRCRNPADYTFAFAGNINIDQMRNLITTYLASIPPEAPFNAWADPHIQLPQNIDKSVYKGKEDKSTVFLGRTLYHDWSMANTIAVEALQEYLYIIFEQRIREKLGGVYSVSVSAGLSPTPPPGEMSLYVYFTCSPSRVDELTVAVEAELNKIAAGIINSETFEKARLARVKSWERSMEENHYISRRFASYAAVFEIPLNYLYKRAEFYEQVTPADLQRLLKTILGRGLVRAVLYPEP